jgi:TATA-box binding protein (TBP) (component of TFIID and TFIIIB)
MFKTSRMDIYFNTIFQRFATKPRQTVVNIPKISTITLLCTLSIKEVDFDTILNCPKLTIRNTVKRGKSKYKSFSNSVTLVFDKTKTIKVFRNLTLHITGCKTIQHSHALVKKFIDCMEWSDVNIVTTSILTLNAVLSFKEKTYISLQNIVKYIEKDDHIRVRYDPDTYQGLVIKALCPFTKRYISLLCFYTGSFIISGVKTPLEMWFGLEFIDNMLKIMMDTIIM